MNLKRSKSLLTGAALVLGLVAGFGATQASAAKRPAPDASWAQCLKNSDCDASCGVGYGICRNWRCLCY